MAKYAFFIETDHRLTGDQKNMLFLAKQLSKDPENVVYYINNIYQEDICLLQNANVIVADANSFDYAQLEGANIFVPTNYLFFLLSRIDKTIKYAKICLWSYDGGSLSRLFAQNRAKRNSSNFLAMIKKRNAVVFSNRLVFYQHCIKYGVFKEKYQPLCFDNIKTLRRKKTVSSRIINIAYISNINSVDAAIITSLCNNIINNANLNNKKVNLHIVGNGGGAWQIDFSKFSSKIHFIYTGDLKDEDLHQYLQNNVDIVFANGEFALESASCSMPTVVPLYSKTQHDNMYVWFYNIKDFDYRWDRDELLLLNYSKNTIGSIIHSVYDNNEKDEHSKKCFDYYMQNNSLASAENVLKKNMNDCKLTYAACINDAYIKGQLNSYKAIVKEYGKMTYKDFFEKKYLVKKTPASIKDAIKHVRNTICFMTQRGKFNALQKAYKKKERFIANNVLKNGKIKVAFIVVFKSVFPTRPIFEKMCADPNFDPYIVAAPNVSRSMKYQRDLYNDTFEGLKEEYGDRVIGGYDIANDKYYELKDEYSVIFFCNPYKHLVHPYHEIEYFLDKPVLPIYSSYGFAALSFWDEVIATDFYNYLWKACVETPSNLKHLQQVQTIKGKNGVVTGYIKADGLANVVPTPRDRKRILICPHHTVWGWKTLNISNFLTYCDLFVELPKMYPDIDFVFRPHPLLMDNLKAHKVWTQQQIDDYLARMLESPNITYDTSGDYYQQFVDSDAMIHDCGSFIGEYLYTEKPCCYMIKSEEETYKGLVPLGQQCMDQYYHAKSKEDIINFIENVVIKGNDPMKAQREAFVKNELKANYPHAADTMINMIKKELKIK